MIDVLAEFGNHRGYTAAQVALAFLLAQKPWQVFLLAGLAIGGSCCKICNN